MYYQQKAIEYFLCPKGYLDYILKTHQDLRSRHACRNHNQDLTSRSFHKFQGTVPPIEHLCILQQFNGSCCIALHLLWVTLPAFWAIPTHLPEATIQDRPHITAQPARASGGIFNHLLESSAKKACSLRWHRFRSMHHNNLPTLIDVVGT